MGSHSVDIELDAIGQKCPMPLLSTKRALNSMVNGQILRIIATDKNAVKDLKAFCEYTDHIFLDHKKQGESFVIYLKKG